MNNTLSIKRKNIDLPIETLQKLSIMAVAQGKSLKAFIESILINKANSVSINVKENPSPSGDSWYAIDENIESVQRGVAEMEAGYGKAYTMEELKALLGV